MNSSSTVLMIKALDGLSARAAVTAQNIANAGTAHYRPLRLSFERALATAAAQGDEAVIALTFSTERAPAALIGNDLRLDLELDTQAATAGRYGAIIDLLSRQLQMRSLAVTGAQ